MKKVKQEETALPPELKKLLPKIDFWDTFSTTNKVNSIEEITQLIFNTTPKWIDFLFKIRNSLAGLFGLRTDMPDDHNESFEVGGYVRFFKIYSITDCEVILGANDPHLNFRAVIINDSSESYNIKVITLVEYNNKKGRVYMNLIAPFHKMVVKRMVKNAHSQKRKMDHFNFGIKASP